jgi:hypothetical protein
MREGTDMVKRPEPGDAAVTASQYEQEQLREWTTYVAIVPIDYYGVRAYNTGDPVPASAVDGDAAWVFDDLVARVGDDAPAYADSATVVPPEPPTVDPAAVAAPAASTPTPAPVDATAAATQES